MEKPHPHEPVSCLHLTDDQSKKLFSIVSSDTLLPAVWKASDWPEFQFSARQRRRIPENKGGHPKFHTAPIRITTVTVVIIIILYIVLLSEIVF